MIQVISIIFRGFLDFQLGSFPFILITLNIPITLKKFELTIHPVPPSFLGITLCM
jgi:hypothetical protein